MYTAITRVLKEDLKPLEKYSNVKVIKDHINATNNLIRELDAFKSEPVVAPHIETISTDELLKEIKRRCDMYVGPAIG